MPRSVSLPQQCLLVAELDLRRWRNRLIVETGLPRLGRGAAVLVAALVLVATSTAVALLTAILASVLPRSADATTVVHLALAGAVLATPFVLGNMSALRLVSVLTDSSHAVVRAALLDDCVLVLARMVVPVLVALAGLLGAAGVVAVVLAVQGSASGTGVAWAALALLYALLVVVVRVLLLAWRLRTVATLRQGRRGLPVVVLLLLAQAVLAYSVPFGAVELRDKTHLRTGWPVSVDQWLVAREVTDLLLLTVLLALLTLLLLRPARTALSRALQQLSCERTQAVARAAQDAAAAAALPLQAERALLVKDVRRALRSGGAVLGPAVGLTMWGVVAGAFLLGTARSGLFWPSHSATAVGMQVLVGALIGVEFAGAGLRLVTSFDADGHAAIHARLAPDGEQLVVRSKARLHARVTGVVGGAVLGALAVLVSATAGAVLATWLLLVGFVVLATIEQVGGSALYPRYDWTSLEEVGTSAKAQSFALGVGVLGVMVLSPVALWLGSSATGLTGLGLALALLLPVAVPAVASPAAVTATSALIRRMHVDRST